LIYSPNPLCCQYHGFLISNLLLVDLKASIGGDVNIFDLVEYLEFIDRMLFIISGKLFIII